MMEDSKKDLGPPKQLNVKRSNIKITDQLQTPPPSHGGSRFDAISRMSSLEGAQHSNIVQDMEQFLLQRVSFAINESIDEFREEDKFMRFLENTANGQVTVQDLHAFSLEPRSRIEPCRAVLLYILNLKSKSTALLQQLKLSQLTSTAQNDLMQEVAKLRSKLRQLDNVKKDELAKKLEAKEHECLEYRAQLTQIEPQKFTPIDTAIKTPKLDADVEESLNQFRQQMDDGHKKISGLIQEMSLLKTQVREKVVLPQFSESDRQWSMGGPDRGDNFQQEEGSVESQEEHQDQFVIPMIKEYRVDDDGVESQHISEHQPEVSSLLLPEDKFPRNDSLRIHGRNRSNQSLSSFVDPADRELAQKLAEFQSHITSELENLQQLGESILTEKLQLHYETSRNKQKEQQLVASNKYLEAKLAQTLTQKEEQNIKLKSELVVYKNKIQISKQKMKEAVETFETKKIQEMRQQNEDMVNLKQMQINQLEDHLEAKNDVLSSLESQIQELNQKLTFNEIDFQAQLRQQNTTITELTERLKGIDQNYSAQLSQVDQIRETTQKRLNIEEQDRTMNSLKLDYLVGNNRKLQLQKKFLEKTIEKYLKNLATERRRAEIDLQRDAFITAHTAQAKLESVFTVVKESLENVKEVLLFMNFEVGDNIQGRALDNDPSFELPIKKDETQHTQQDSPVQQPDRPSRQSLAENKPLDFFFYKHIYEIAEVVLSVVCEIYKDSQTQVSLETVHLFTLIQSKTDKSIVQDLYNKFFAQNRIHFTQHLQRTVNRNATLEREKAEMRRKLEDLTKALQTAQKSQRGHRSQESLHDDPNQIVARNSAPNISQATDQSSPSHPDSQRRTLSPAAVVSALQRFQEKKIIESQQEELSALKARMKEVRLNLQRQISDLQDQLDLSKEYHQADQAKLRLEYGRDLNALHKSHLLKEDELRQVLDGEYQLKIQQLQSEHEAYISELNIAFDNDFENLRKELERSDMMKTEIEREIKKLKKKSNSSAQGGWGTFTVAFEDNSKKHHPLILGTQLHTTSSVRENPAPKKIIPGLGQASDFSTSANSSQAFDSHSLKSFDDSMQHNQTEGMSVEKLSHFIEVGFLMDQKNFRHLDTYKEKTFDSQLTKHLFEFQDPIDNFKAVQLQNKIKSQLYENYALFNEINPVYVTFNLGRNVSPFWDESLSQEHFKLIKREGFYLGGETYLTVNFLRCDEPNLVIRVVAFDNETCSSYSFDLLFEDLMLFVDGNMKLLDADSHHDLCQMIMNNLTLVHKRAGSLQENSIGSINDGGGSADNDGGEPNVFSSKLARSTQQSKPTMSESQLAVEHKIFFNEHYKNEYERNKLIIAKNDKRKKGLLQDKGLATEFQKSIVYEAFDNIYTDSLRLSDHSQFGSQIVMELIQGRMSEHLILKVYLQSVQSVEVEEADDGSISLGSNEVTIFTQELCIYQSELTKLKQTQQIASIIVKVPPSAVSILDRVLAYVVSFERIFGTENFVIRIAEVTRYDQQTMSKFNWDPLAESNFGSLSHIEHTVFLVRKNNNHYLRLTHYEVLNTEIRSLLFKHSYGYDLSIVDFGKLQAVQSKTVQLRLPASQDPPQRDSPTQGMVFLFRDFGIIRARAQDDTLLNHYCVFAFYDDHKCLNHGEVFVQIQIDGLFQDLTVKVTGVAELLKLTPEAYRDKIYAESERICKQIFDQLVLIVEESRVIVDQMIEPMSGVIDQLKRRKYKVQLDQNDVIGTEFEDAKDLGVTLNVLAECHKINQVSIINRKIFKVTCYFVNNLKNLKLANIPERHFDWQIIYIEAETRTSTKSLLIALTENDLLAMVEQLMERQHGGEQLLKSKSDIISSRVSRKKLVEFIIDSIVIDDANHQLKISITHLRSRMQDRILMQKFFKIVGGRYLPSNQSTFFDDQEMANFKTSLPQIEMRKHLIVNVEKDFSDRKYDIRIFEVEIKHSTNATKYQFEMFAVDKPQVVFRADFLSKAQQQGKKLLVERFNVIQQLHQDFEDDKFAKDGMVLAVLEQGFPHSMTFMVLEPISHIQWQFQFSDDKLNPIENRQEKEFFLKNCKNLIENGLWFDQVQSTNGLPPAPQDIVVELLKTGYQKEVDTYTNPDAIEMWQGSLRPLFQEGKSDIIYQREVEIQEGVFAEIAVLYESEFNSLKMVINRRAETSFVVESKRESSRFLSGFLPVNDRAKVFYVIETACGFTEQERAFRIIIKEPTSGRKLIDFVLSEKHIIETSQQTSISGNKFKVFSVKESAKYAFNTGFKDSYALFQKMPEMVTDFKQAFIVNEDRLRFSIPVDTSKVLHRKVVTLPSQQTFIIYLKCDNFPMADKQFKVILFEQASNYEESFLFETAKILTKDELQTLSQTVLKGNEKQARDCFSKVVEQRLKIKVMGEDMQVVTPLKGENDRYIVYFLEATSVAPEGPGLTKQYQKFDIRNGFRFSLTDPDAILPQSEYLPQEKMISQLEKDDLLFDVSEVLNPFQLILRIKTYDKESLKVISVSDMQEAQIKEELTKDQVSFLLSDPHRRDELARYLVQNTYFDDTKKRVFFLQTGNAAQIKRRKTGIMA